MGEVKTGKAKAKDLCACYRCDERRQRASGRHGEPCMVEHIAAALEEAWEDGYGHGLQTGGNQ